MFVDGNPIDGLTMFIGPIGIAFVMLHMHGVVIRLRETARNRLQERESPVQKWRTEKWIVNEVVTHAVDVCVDHQRIYKSEDQHDPEGRARIKKEEREEIREVEQTGERRNDIPPRVREKP